MGGSGHGRRPAEEEKNQVQGRDRTARRRKSGSASRSTKPALLAGGTVEDAKETKAKAEDDDNGPFKEVTKGYRWVAITGTLDHGQMRAYYREALKNPAVAHPHYARLDLQRKVLRA